MKIQPAAVVASIVWPLIAAGTCPVEPTSVPTAVAKSLAINKLSALLKCEADDPLNDQSPCNTFAGRGLEAIYSISDFKTGNTYLSANGIADYVAGNDRWVNLGTIFNEDNNLCAQALINNAYAVIAIRKSAGHGHIALVIPGDPSKSPSWGMFAANSASFFIGKPDTTYVNGPLSKAFRTDDAKTANFFYPEL